MTTADLRAATEAAEATWEAAKAALEAAQESLREARRAEQLSWTAMWHAQEAERSALITPTKEGT